MAMLLLFSAAFSQQKLIGSGGWVLAVDPSGEVASMSFTNPKTELNIEASIEITTDNRGMPVSGKVKYRDGIARAFSPEELTVYWDEYKGAHALWSHFASTGKLNAASPDEAQIPAKMFGNFSRVITKNGDELFGKLVPKYTLNGATGEILSDWFALDVEGHEVTFYRHAVAVIQQMR
jgi:hypothetical protein